MHLCRWLALHNSTLSVRALIEQINRPSEKASYEAAASTYSTTEYGSTENYVNYLKIGMFLATLDSINTQPHTAFTVPGTHVDATKRAPACKLILLCRAK